MQFVDATRASGISFRHHSGAFGQKYMPETTGSGCAFFDADGDGWLDLLAINSCDWPGHRRGSHRSALYRNRTDGSFVDVTTGSGLPSDVYGMGAAVGDYDNDGDEDLYLTCLGPNHLLRNRSDGRFEDVTASAGVAGASVSPGGLRWKWSSSAAWVDYDRDGRLDIFVCNYVKWSPETDVFCRSRRGEKAYCAPTSYTGVPCTLYRNRGDGTFADVSEETGIRQEIGKSLGVAIADMNGDQWPDIVVANDMTPNFLFLNVPASGRDGETAKRRIGATTNPIGNAPFRRLAVPPIRRFDEVGAEWGIGVGESGRAKAGMGIDAADWQNRGRPGLLVGNFSHEALSLFAPDEPEGLIDVTYAEGMGEPSLHYLTFGLCFLDYDLDGWLDAFIGNGHIDDTIEGSQITYRQRPLLFHSDGGRGFREVGLASGVAMAEPLVVRGLARGDYDRDGDPDVALIWNNVGLRILRNDAADHLAARGGAPRHWIGFRMVGRRSNRSALGARVRVTAGDLTQTRWVGSGSSYLSSHQLLVPIGLGAQLRADTVVIDWPSGASDRFASLAADRYYVVREGESASGAKIEKEQPTNTDEHK